LTSRRDGIPGVDEKKAGVLLCKAADFIGMDTQQSECHADFCC